MRKLEDIQGGEFDWFAKDSGGQYALFATAGEGFVPKEALLLADVFEEISDAIDAPHWGSENVWDDYASVGIYVYDWKLHGGPYVRVRCPAIGVAASLVDKLNAIDSFPKFDGHFRKTANFECW